MKKILLIEQKLYIYKWSENHVITQQQQHSACDNGVKVNLQEAIKTELYTIIPQPGFSSMHYKFLMNFVVEKGFYLFRDDFLRKKYNHHYEDEVFECLFNLAEKQALQKQKMSSGNFNVDDSIKADLAKVIRRVKWYRMDKQFLMDFVVPKGVITKEQAKHVYDTRVCITHNGKSIYGVFKDVIGLRQAYNTRIASFTVRRRSTTKIRFYGTRYSIPSTPSTVTKMRGVDWYLCVEKDDVLSFKSYSEVLQSDYLLAEMKSETDFNLISDETTSLTAE